MPRKNIAVRTEEFLDYTRASRRLEGRIGREPKLRKLVKHAESRGNKRAKGEKHVLGFRQTFKSKKPVKAPKGSCGQVEEMTFELLVQNFTRAGSAS